MKFDPRVTCMGKVLFVYIRLPTTSITSDRQRNQSVIRVSDQTAAKNISRILQTGMCSKNTQLTESKKQHPFGLE